MVKKEYGEKKRLEDYGIIFIAGEIDEARAKGICEQIIKINIERSTGFIQLIINSRGGSVSAGFSIIDMMEWSSLPVYATGIGSVSSIALAIFMAAEKGRRILTPRTSLLSHRFSGMSLGSHSQLIAKRKQEDLLHDRLIAHYIEHSALHTPEEVERLLLKESDTWLTPEEAIKFGLADLIQKKNRAA